MIVLVTLLHLLSYNVTDFAAATMAFNLGNIAARSPS